MPIIFLNKELIMKNKIFRCISELKILDDGTLFYEQKITFAWYLRCGLLVFFFKKKNRNLINIKDIKEIEAKQSFWTGNTITLITEQNKIILEATSKEHLKSMVEFLLNSQLKEKFTAKGNLANNYS